MGPLTVAALCSYTEGEVLRALVASAGAGKLGVFIAETAMVPVEVPVGGPQGKPSVQNWAMMDPGEC